MTTDAASGYTHNTMQTSLQNELYRLSECEGLMKDERRTLHRNALINNGTSYTFTRSVLFCLWILVSCWRRHG